MDPRLQEALNGAGENYIAPFFWQHGEEDGILQEEIEKIYQSGIRAVCVESRPHEGFCGPSWWEADEGVAAGRQAFSHWLCQRHIGP